MNHCYIVRTTHGVLSAALLKHYLTIIISCNSEHFTPTEPSQKLGLNKIGQVQQKLFGSFNKHNTYKSVQTSYKHKNLMFDIIQSLVLH